MKSLFKNLLLLSAPLALIFLFSCGDGDTEDLGTAVPEVGVTVYVNGAASSADPIEASASDSLSFDVDITAEGGFNTVRASYAVDGGSPVSLGEVSRDSLGLSAGTTIVPTVEFIVPSLLDHVGSTLTFTFTAVDDVDLGQTGTASVDVMVTSPEARSYSAVLLAAPLQDAGGTPASKTSETFFSTNTGMTYSMNDINSSVDPLSANIDFGYFFGSGLGGTRATLSDPASYPFAYGQAAWGTRNSTTFRRTSLNEAAFIEVTTYASIEAAYEAADAADADAGIESGLAVGEVLAFETDADKDGGSRKGLILVKAIVEGDGENGKITLDVIVQESAE